MEGIPTVFQISFRLPDNSQDSRITTFVHLPPQLIRFMKKIILLFFIFFQMGLVAQETLKESGSWWTLGNKFQVSDQLSFSQISQMRRVGFMEHTQVILLKPSVNFKATKSLSFGLGYVYFKSFPNGVRHASIKKEENRIWQHVTLSAKLGSISLSNRFVFEQRFKDVINNKVNPNVIDGTQYAQRLRYRLQLSFKVATIGNGRLLLGKISNELRIRFKSGLSEPDYDQNNFRVLAGTSLIKNSSIWFGYGRDYNKINSELFLANDIFLISLNYDVDLRSKK